MGARAAEGVRFRERLEPAAFMRSGERASFDVLPGARAADKKGNGIPNFRLFGP
jgi:hypothetical protein